MAGPNRFYSSTAVAAKLIAPMSPTDLTWTVNSTTGFPTSFPYTLVIDGGTDSQEITSVTSASGPVLSGLRGQDGSSATSHDNGAAVTHDVSARDFAEPQLHLGSNSGVHGVTGSVVGTTDTQTLTNKTLTAPTINGGAISGGATINGAPASSTVTLNGTQVLTNKTLTAPITNGGDSTGEAFVGAALDATSTVNSITGTQIAADHSTLATVVTNQATDEANLASLTGRLLLATRHVGASGTYVQTSTSLTVVDATNLVFTFTPTTARVLIRLSALFLNDANLAFLGLMQGASTVVSGAVISQTPNSGSGAEYMTIPFIVSGLTPGTPLTYAWATASATSGATLPAVTLDASHGGAGLPVTEVWAA